MEEIGVPERCAQTEDVVSLGVLWDGLHDGSVHNDQVFGRGLDASPLPRVAGVEEEGRALQTDPVSLPATLASELNLKERIFFNNRKENPGGRVQIFYKCLPL